MEKKYKVEIVKTEKFVIDVLASNEKEAELKVMEVWNQLLANRTEHYYQVGDMETEIGTIYDVTGTDNPFNP